MAKYERILLKLSGEAMAGPAVVRHRSGARQGSAPSKSRRLRSRASRSAWWSAAAISSAASPGRQEYGPRHRRSHGHAGDGDQFARAAGRAGTDGPAYARDERHRDASGRRALHPPPRHPASGKRPHRDLRGGHFQSLFFHRHRGHPARARDQSSGHRQSHQGRRRLRQRSDEARRCRDVPRHRLYRSADEIAGRDGCDLHRDVPR